MKLNTLRPRRLRRTAAVRSMVRETSLEINDFIYPIFVVPGANVKEEIPSMPGCYHLSVDQAVKQAEEDYNIARVRYNAGVGTNLEVMRSSDNLTTARTNYATALYRYNTSKAALDNAMGVPVDLDAMQYRRVIDHGKRARAAREAAVLHADAVLETPKGAQVRPAEPAPTAEEAAASIERVRAANAAYEMTMAK